MVRIFVEGKRDRRFINAYINYLFPKKNNKPFEINALSGFTMFSVLANKCIENTDAQGTNLVIFDADFLETDGGFTKRKEFLLAKKLELDIEFDLFLLPNDQQDGMCETLLENIAKSEHKVVLDCFESYENCLKQHKDDKGNYKYVVPDRKLKITAFVNSIPKNRKQKQNLKKNWFLDIDKYWEFDNPYLKPLKFFLNTHLSPSTTTT